MDRASSAQSPGPLFVAYAHHGSGPKLKDEVTATLRAWGLPVRDGVVIGNEIGRSLQALLSKPLSGGVIVLPPEMADGAALREIEVPELVRLASDRHFTLLMGNAVTRPDGSLDPKAPDELLRYSGVKLSNFPQFPIATPAGQRELAQRAAMLRVQSLAETGADTLPLQLFTRAADVLGHEQDAGLVVCWSKDSAGSRVPPPETWALYVDFLAQLAGLVHASGARTVRVSGRPHLSAAFALGATLIKPVCNLVVLDRDEQAWIGEADIAPMENLDERSAHGQPVAVFVDMIEDGSFTTFERHVETHPGGFSATLRLTYPGPRRTLTAAEGATLARGVARRIREFVRSRDAALHLFLAVPYPMAVLLGRESNTLHVQLYERDGDPPGHYVPTLRCAAGENPPVALATHWAKDTGGERS